MHVSQSLIGFIEIVERFDIRIPELVAELRGPLLTKVMNSVTGLGSVTAGLVFLGLFYLSGWEREFRVTLVGLTLSGLLVATLMLTLQRAYPPQPVCLTGGAETIAHSFPSGHAAAVAVYATVAYRSEHLPFVVVTALATAIAISRVYLGTHYFSDTVVGILIGVGTALVADRIVRSERFTSGLTE